MSVRPQTTARVRAWLLCLACAAVCPAGAGAGAQAERAWAWQNPLPQGNAIHAVRFAADKRTGWAVGADGVILHTSDGGFRWEEQQTPAPVPLYGLYVRDAKRAVAVGARGVVLTTDDGGGRWTLRPVGGKPAKNAPAVREGANHLFGVAFAPDAVVRRQHHAARADRDRPLRVAHVEPVERHGRGRLLLLPAEAPVRRVQDDAVRAHGPPRTLVGREPHGVDGVALRQRVLPSPPLLRGLLRPRRHRRGPRHAHHDDGQRREHKEAHAVETCGGALAGGGRRHKA